MGTVVHLALEELSLGGEPPQDCRPDDRERWRRALRMQGLAGAALEHALQQVLENIAASLCADGPGRWILSPAHAQARSEWPLVMLDGEGRPRTLVIDRSFVDVATGERWIVDYKTSRPLAGESLTVFRAREAEAYREQLAGYRDALAALGPEPVRCALFFTALGELHELGDLALAAR